MSGGRDEEACERSTDAGRGDAKWHPAVEAETQKGRKAQAQDRVSALQSRAGGNPQVDHAFRPPFVSCSREALDRDGGDRARAWKRRWEPARVRQVAPFFTWAVRLTQRRVLAGPAGGAKKSHEEKEAASDPQWMS